MTWEQKNSEANQTVLVPAVPANNPPQPIYRCGNEYTNQPKLGAVACQRLSLHFGAASPLLSQPAVRPLGVETTTTKAETKSETKPDSAATQRENEAKSILQSELRRAQNRFAQLQSEFKNGEPDKYPAEQRNPALYAQRLSEMKAAMERAQADVGSIQSELTRWEARR